MTEIDMVSALPVVGQKCEEIALGDANNAPNPVCHQELGVDPTTNRPGRHLQQFGDLPDGEESRILAREPTMLAAGIVPRRRSVRRCRPRAHVGLPSRSEATKSSIDSRGISRRRRILTELNCPV